MSAAPAHDDDSPSFWEMALGLVVVIVLAPFSRVLDALTMLYWLARGLLGAGVWVLRLLLTAIFGIAEWLLAVRDSFPGLALERDQSLRERHASIHRKVD